MVIEQLSADKMLITLHDDDLCVMGTSFERMSGDDVRSRRLLLRLLLTACRSYGIDCRGKKFVIEALPTAGGCILLVSVAREKKRKIYRIKHIGHHDAFVFDSFDDVADGLSRLFEIARPALALYRHSGRYLLTVNDPLWPHERLLISEYGRRVRLTAMQRAYIFEHAALIADGAMLLHSFSTRPSCCSR